ncbi:MAG: hypothetical protein GY730_02585 [bacterium]|nr:hypothetical protein [bacterium]
MVFPVYFFGLPEIVSNFLDKLKTSRYFFVVINYGMIPGPVLKQVEGILKENKVHLSAGFKIRMPDNYIPLVKAFSEKKQQKIFEREKSRIKEISAIIREEKHYMEKESFLFNWSLKFLYNVFLKKLSFNDRNFWVDKRCDYCGLCQKICSVNNITINDSSILWNGSCQQCLACLQWCPKEAVQYKNSTIGRVRYRNPEVKATDLLRDISKEQVKQ